MDRKAIVACLSLLLASCSSRNAIVVGSKNFTEQVLLGEILAQQIERQLGTPVVRKLDLGGTLLAHEALRAGSIDLYPEYTGTALTAVVKRPPAADPQVVLDSVREAYHRQWQLAWLPPLGFNNTFAMIVRREEKLRTLSDAARARAWRLGVGYEFQQRPDGLDGMLKTYGLRLAGEPVTMDLGLLYSALQGRKVDMIAANSTDGLISVLDVSVLEDDRRYFPPYQCAVVVREAALASYPKLRGVLEQLSGSLSDDAMRRLNYEVDGKHRAVAQVAEEFLKTLAAAGQPRPDVTSEAWYPQAVAQLTAMNLQAERLLEGGKPDEAAAIITDGQPVVTRVLSVPRPTLAAMEAASDLDQLYGRMLLSNRNYGWARLLFQKNVSRWKNWQPQTPETVRRLKMAADAVAECDRHLAE